MSQPKNEVSACNLQPYMIDTLAASDEQLPSDAEQQPLTTEQQKRIADGLLTMQWSSENSENSESEIETVRIELHHKSGRFKHGKKPRVDKVLRDLEALNGTRTLIL